MYFNKYISIRDNLGHTGKFAKDKKILQKNSCVSLRCLSTPGRFLFKENHVTCWYWSRTNDTIIVIISFILVSHKTYCVTVLFFFLCVIIFKSSFNVNSIFVSKYGEFHIFSFLLPHRFCTIWNISIYKSIKR